MRKISNEYRDSAAGKELAEGQTKFLEASQKLVEANRNAIAAGNRSTPELNYLVDSLSAAEERMKSAEAKLDELIGEPDRIALTDLVTRKVRESFSTEQQAEVVLLLETECATKLPLSENELIPQGLERIRLAVVKVADGSVPELRQQIETAKEDWRDVLNAAEYPEATKLGLLDYSNLDEQTRREIDQRDHEQYLAWLGNTKTGSKLLNIWNKLWPWEA